MYPRTVNELIKYLTQHREVKVRFPHQETTYTFKGSDGFRMTFTTAKDFDIIYPCASFEGADFTEDGFTRTVGPLLSYFSYTGPKPWKEPHPQWKQNIEDWDGVFAGLKNFAD